MTASILLCCTKTMLHRLLTNVQHIMYVYLLMYMHVTLVIAIRCPAAMQLFGLSNAPNSHHHHHYVHPWTEVHSNAGFLFQLSSAHITPVPSSINILCKLFRKLL